MRFAFVLASLIACSTDVDLGGTGPTTNDGGSAVDHCGTLVAPAVAASCHACSASSPDCQANGCYGGYWCDTVTVDCHVPPKTCP